ncbi:ribonuclease P protein component [Vaccinium witches'-broom phytoplasma]|uniref:ribonuclease P protein component n=1 Tax=Vaccinium witches'-broom phytoplasma TaxID=85642 RepID=UPI00037640E1|nr:ribonuclease P protein component [Vaccinium witches'-broom phytoplasma]
MKRKFILRKNSEIDLIFKLNKNKNIRNGFFTLYYAKNNHFKHFKFALSISKKYGKSHERNLIKRRLRMIICQNMNMINPHTSFVLVIKPKAKELDFVGLSKYFLILIKTIS